MRRFATAAAVILLATASAASAQTGLSGGTMTASPNLMFGQNWNMPQDLASMEATQAGRPQRHLSNRDADLARRAARQAQFNRNFPGTPIRVSQIGR
jgi:hypothetical protein